MASVSNRGIARKFLSSQLSRRTRVETLATQATKIQKPVSPSKIKQVLTCGLQLHYDKHFDFKMANQITTILFRI